MYIAFTKWKGLRKSPKFVGLRNFEKLIEDELLYWNASNIYLDKGFLEESIAAERMFGIFIYIKVSHKLFLYDRSH